MRNLKPFLFLSLLTFVLSLTVSAQMARKPSPTREPAGAMDKKPDSNKNSLPAIKSQAEFDTIARTYHQGTPYAMPHTMFVIDRQSKNKIYYLNSQKYRFHKDFLLGTYLVPRGSDVFKPIYIDADRRFLVGTVAWQKTVDKWTWELWEGDLATAEMIKTANDTINKTFFAPVAYKPNSIRQDDASAKLGITRITQDEINKNQEYLALNTGKAIGRIHIIDKLDDTVEIGSNEILILKELPQSLPPVAGIIVAKPSTPLSHINILARGWNIPNVYIKDADKLYKELDTYWGELDAKLTDYKLQRADQGKIKEYTPPDIVVPPINLKPKKLAGLHEMRKKDSIIYGSKAANLGEMINSKQVSVSVPDGFSIPFYWYDKFMKDNGFDDTIEDFLYDNDFVHNPRIRRQKLDDFRKAVQNGKFDDELKREIIQKWKTQLGGQPVFVRSSSNSEDLPNFSGAGLYKSVPNVTKEDDLIEAVKTVWASLWRFEAYEARVRNYVSQTDVYMSALVQTGINMDKGGVMITKDPFDEKNINSVYISVVCGHNSPVVDNNGLPEQLLYNPRSRTVVAMTVSDKKNSLRFNPAGGLVESPDNCANPTTKRILTDPQARQLASTAMTIKRIFGNKAPQDIEWGFMKGRLYIIQARPYIEK
jgi:rifampicin phosphotransferase